MDALAVPGIGPKTKHLLTLILEKGRDEAIAEVNSDRQTISQVAWKTLEFRHDRATGNVEGADTVD